MKITMDDSRITSVNQLRAFLKGSEKYDLSLREAPLKERYAFIDQVVNRFRYRKLSKKDKRVVLRYVRKVTGYKKRHLYRLVNRAGRGRLTPKPYQREKTHRFYQTRDIKLLEKTDELHLRLNGLATREILRREYEVFAQNEYATIAGVSLSHLYNLRRHPAYVSSWVNHTASRTTPIGISQPPENFGRPGSIRVDTVHQNDVYHINAVDEIVQWEVVICVPQISERFLKVALGLMVEQFPFEVFNFHSDRGSEYINYLVAQLLQRLAIKQTKSRPRRPNDNALVETKNGAVVRKNLGWEYIDQGASELINAYYQEWFNPYLNFHRPSLFATGEKVDAKGRKRKVYGEATVPYEKLKEVSKATGKNFLKPGVTFDTLDTMAYKYSDNQWAEMMRKEETKLFRTIRKLGHGSRRRDT